MIINKLRNIAFILVLFVLSQCATPQPVYFDVDIADTTSFNLNPLGENVTVLFVVENDSLMREAEIIANSMAAKYEEDQALDEEVVGVYLIPKREYDLDNEQYLTQLSENSNCRFLIFVSDFVYKESEIEVNEGYTYATYMKTFPYSANVTIYDSARKDFVKRISASSHISVLFDSYSEIKSQYSTFNTTSESVNKAIGSSLASYISTKWDTKEVMIVNYPSDQNWENAVKYASEFQFEKAIRIWLPYTSNSTDEEKEAFAAYNIAIAFQMMGKNDFALEWVEYSLNKYRTSFAMELYKSLKTKK